MTGEMASALLDQAIAALRHPLPDRSAAVAELLEAAAPRIATIPPSDPQLAQVKNKLLIVQSLAGQAAGYYRGLQQVNGDRVVAYTASGMEEAL
jgi:hypothetical protein